MVKWSSFTKRLAFVLLMATIMVAVPVSAADSIVRTVTTQGVAEVPGQPAAAHMDITISCTDKNADTARNEAAKRMAAVKEALLAEGIGADDIRTSNLTMSTSTDSRTGETSFTTKHSLSIVIEDVQKLGKVFDLAILAGATRIDGISYIIKDQTVLEETAMRQAMQDARRKAAVLADVSAESLTAVKITDLTARYASGGSGWFAAAPRANTEVLLHAIPVKAQVEVEFAY